MYLKGDKQYLLFVGNVRDYWSPDVLYKTNVHRLHMKMRLIYNDKDAPGLQYSGQFQEQQKHHKSFSFCGFKSDFYLFVLPAQTNAI